MKGRKYLILIAVICAAAIVSLCGCRAYSLENTAEEVESVPPALTETEEEPKAPPPASPVIDGGDNGGDISYAGVSNAVTEVAAQLAYTPIDDEHCEVYCTNKDEATYADIPNTAMIDGKRYTVTQIAKSAFCNNRPGEVCPAPLKEVMLPVSVKQIDVCAFQDCRYLTDINLRGVEKFGLGALRGCESLASVNLSSALIIDTQAFMHCTNLECVYMQQATEIYDEAFGHCDKLSEIVIPKSVVLMKEGIFSDCDTQIKVAKGTNTVNWSRNWNNFNANQDVIYDYLIPAELSFTMLNETECTVSCLNNKIAMVADNIPSTVIIEGKEYIVTEIASGGFAFSPELESVTLPDTVVKICNSAFTNCPNLTNVVMPNVREMGNYVFRKCPQLSILVIPDTVKNMGASIVRNNNTQVCAYAKSQPEGWNSNWNLYNENQNVIWGWKDSDVLAEFKYTPVSEEYMSCSVECTNPTEATVAVIPEKTVIDGKEYAVTHIADDCFYMGSKLERVVLPDTVLVVGRGAFVACELLTEISLPNAQIIYDAAFSDCSKLQSISLPQAVAINQMAFDSCYSLSLAEIPKAEWIEIYAFADCYSLKEIIIPKSAKRIMGGIFDGCDTQVYAEAKAKPAGWDDGWNNGNANQDVIWGWADSIARYEFIKLSATECSVRCINKTTAVEAYIPATAVIDGKEYTVTEIVADGFVLCPKLKKVVLSRTVKKINNMAFAWCPELNSVSLANVEEIGNNAFCNCPKLKEIVIPKSVVNVGVYILRNNDTKVYVRGSSDEGWNEGWNEKNSGEVEFNSAYYQPVEIKKKK